MLMDSDYTLGLDIIEADAHSYEFSSSTFANKMFPKMNQPSYDMKVFVKQAESTPETVEKKTCWTVRAGAEAAVGLDVADSVEVGASLIAQISREECSEWVDVPGGYNVHLSVFDQQDPAFAQAYGLVPEFNYKLPTDKTVAK